MVSLSEDDTDWNFQHVASPSVVSVGDYTLLAYEGYTDESVSGIGLALAVERWLETDVEAVQFEPVDQEHREMTINLENFGLGDLTVISMRVAGPGFSMDTAGGFVLATGEKKVVTVRFSGEMPGDYEGIVVIRSDSQVDPVQNISLMASIP